ncbi:MAG TPA: hypothetical protein VK524_16930, partial [Polyangiaceae bacterium]|nr:hypothetical protein [Polyangiaceae bacterium]
PVGIPKPSGLSAPPFGHSTKPTRIDASDPYAPISAEQAAGRAEPKAIKVEMSDEVVQAQKKGRSKVMALAGITAVVGGIIGFAYGGSSERGKTAQAALSGAKELVKEIETANAEIEKLADVLKNAKQKLADNKYPADEVQALGGIDIPFAGSNLTDKGIGRFKADLVTQLVSFASGAQEANDQKDKISRLLGGSKQAITEFLTQQTDPKVRWSVYVQNGPLGPWAVMQPLPEAFAVNKKEKQKDKDGKEVAYKWPEEFKISDDGRTFDLKRYTSGDPTGSSPKIIPVDPGSQAGVCPSDVVIRLRRELGDLEETLRGVKGDPADERAGLLDLGQSVHEKLKQIGSPGA